MIIVFVLLSFGVFFVAFHNVFFDPGTWMFEFSDTLIRLFPERFWRDIFIYVGVLAGGAGLLIGFLLNKNRGHHRKINVMISSQGLTVAWAVPPPAAG